jgi:hypothetical protein
LPKWDELVPAGRQQCLASVAPLFAEIAQRAEQRSAFSSS